MMSDHGIELGDSVRLKSGGPLMTYEGESHSTGDAICTWFDGTQRCQETFNHRAIEKADGPEAGPMTRVGR
ncbi:DUF2158 domain-containing protein [Rubellimicrobium roseum]|uniref:DUF2158 domain-containing protein n=2 Tax=Rubellimicrobium roseum TaxID=687525 RepID=A0A5C4N5J5_9RHOB|nr:DUF2158 domain-containing protein [Rubellimicrobium roseum]